MQGKKGKYPSSPRILSSIGDVNITHHPNDIGDPLFHVVDSLEGGDGLVTNQFDFGLGRRTAISSTADVLAATAVFFDEVS